MLTAIDSFYNFLNLKKVLLIFGFLAFGSSVTAFKGCYWQRIVWNGLEALKQMMELFL